MADTDPRPTNVPSSDTGEDHGVLSASWFPRLVWLLVSAGFLAYLAFGTIEARIWNFGRLFFQDRDITHVWAYFGDRLPEMPASPVIPILYYLSLAVMVAGTLLGLWYFLVERDDHDQTRAPTHASLDSPQEPKQQHG